MKRLLEVRKEQSFSLGKEGQGPVWDAPLQNQSKAIALITSRETHIWRWTPAKEAGFTKRGL